MTRRLVKRAHAKLGVFCICSSYSLREAANHSVYMEIPQCFSKYIELFKFSCLTPWKGVRESLGSHCEFIIMDSCLSMTLPSLLADTGTMVHLISSRV